MTEQTRQLKRGFAHKKPLALAVESIILKTMIDSQPVYDPLEVTSLHDFPPGEIIKMVLRHRFEQDQRLAHFAMTNAPFHDQEEMSRRFTYLTDAALAGRLIREPAPLV